MNIYLLMGIVILVEVLIAVLPRKCPECKGRLIEKDSYEVHCSSCGYHARGDVG